MARRQDLHQLGGEGEGPWACEYARLSCQIRQQLSLLRERQLRQSRLQPLPWAYAE